MPVTDVEKDLDALTLTITAEFDADAERLWELWADPRQLEQWWSPPSHTSTFLEHELTPGARTTYYMTGPDGEKHHGSWRIEEVEPPHRLRLKDDEVDAEGNPEDGGPSAMTVTITEADGTATMSIQTHFTDRTSMEQTIEAGFEQGMIETVNQVDSLLGVARA
ncbi:MAG TPA: SRPBCC domain-containing protein [Solirubrobacterales bacterium]|nr:SRPBCC domain-containing protein [Solirubrobacterales bacterium]